LAANTCSPILVAVELMLQCSLLGAGEPSIDPELSGVERTPLGAYGDAWVDFLPEWLGGPDTLFAQLLDGLEWQGRVRPMYERMVDQPRLTARLPAGAAFPARPVIHAMRDALGRRYGRAFTGVGLNLYRDGRDSVAWHGDRVARDLPEALVGIVSLGGRRRFLLRPKGGGPSVRFDVGAGDLLVMGGSCQRTWEHSVPKAARAEPRISITFRHAYERVDGSERETGREATGAVHQLDAAER
jgi:alkylated DNA repair dioxygenase AlkB